MSAKSSLIYVNNSTKQLARNSHSTVIANPARWANLTQGKVCNHRTKSITVVILKRKDFLCEDMLRCNYWLRKLTEKSERKSPDNSCNCLHLFPTVLFHLHTPLSSTNMSQLSYWVSQLDRGHGGHSTSITRNQHHKIKKL